MIFVVIEIFFLWVCQFVLLFVLLRLTEILIDNFWTQSSDIFSTASDSFIIYCSLTGYSVTFLPSLEHLQHLEDDGRFNLNFFAILYK